MSSHQADDIRLFWSGEDNCSFDEICSQFHDKTAEFLQNGDLKEDIEMILKAYDNQEKDEVCQLSFKTATTCLNKEDCSESFNTKVKISEHSSSNYIKHKTTSQPPPYWSHSSQFIDSLKMGLSDNVRMCQKANENISNKTNAKRKSPETDTEHSFKKRRRDRGNEGRHTANVRERTRMRVLSSAFDDLKDVLPWVPPDTRLSKLETLKLACSYIEHLNATVLNKYQMSYNQVEIDNQNYFKNNNQSNGFL